MIVSAIVAVASNLAIGLENQLLWHLPVDMKYFKNTTTGHHIITGRKSYISIPEKFRPLPNRTNVVVSRQTDLSLPGTTIVHSVETALELAKKNKESEAFIIGGGEIYKYALEKNLIQKLYITWVDHIFEADTFFPEVDFEKWELISKVNNDSDEKNPWPTSFCVYQKSNRLL